MLVPCLLSTHWPLSHTALRQNSDEHHKLSGQHNCLGGMAVALLQQPLLSWLWLMWAQLWWAPLPLLCSLLRQGPGLQALASGAGCWIQLYRWPTGWWLGKCYMGSSWSVPSSSTLHHTWARRLGLAVLLAALRAGQTSWRPSLTPSWTALLLPQLLTGCSMST